MGSSRSQERQRALGRADLSCANDHHPSRAWLSRGPLPPSARLGGIEGLRALAASGVLIWHVWAHETNAPGYGVGLPPFTKLFDNARVGVAMFFVLSGFLLYRPFAAATIRRLPQPSVRRYFRSRALRILPAYWAVLLAVAVLLQRELLERPLQLLANLTFVQIYVPSYVTPVHGLGIDPAWSLCVEVVFYLLLPLLSLLAFGLAEADFIEPVAATFVPVLLLALTGIASLVSFRLFRLGTVWRTGFPPHAHWFAVGMALGVVRVLWEDGRVRLRRWWRPAAVTAILTLSAVALKLDYSGWINFDEEQSLLAVACGLLLALVVLPAPRSLLVRVLEGRPFVGLGLVSYGVFLWHDPILRALRDGHVTESGRVGFAFDLLLVGGITVAASILLYRFVEKPALARKGGGPPTPRADERAAELSAAP